ncbi:MAG: Gfo/Idh/MocA family oxidoreductase [Acidobacteriota bacterium]
MSKPTIRIALVGQGFMGRAHSNAYCQAPHFFDLPFALERRVICGRNRESLERMAATWGWAETQTDWRAVVGRPDVDLVDIAAPNALHAPIAIAAAEAGKIVLCEKPLATSAEEGMRMAEAARHVPNMVWFNYRRVPAVAFCRRLIDDGRIGQVFHYRATYLQQWGGDPGRASDWKMQRQHAGSGVLGDLLSHLVDTALWLNGPISEVAGLLHTFIPGRDVDDAALLLARFTNGSIGTFEATRFAVGCRNRNAFEINGERGMLRFNLEDLNRLEFVDAAERPELQGARSLLVTGPGHPYVGNFWKPGHVIGYEHTFIAALADFLEGLARGEAAHPTFEDALRTQLVLDAVERSAGSRGWQRVGDIAV